MHWVFEWMFLKPGKEGKLEGSLVLEFSKNIVYVCSLTLPHRMQYG